MSVGRAVEKGVVPPGAPAVVVGDVVASVPCGDPDTPGDWLGEAAPVAVAVGVSVGLPDVEPGESSDEQVAMRMMTMATMTASIAAATTAGLLR